MRELTLGAITAVGIWVFAHALIVNSKLDNILTAVESCAK